jgi:hypothetical protein
MAGRYASLQSGSGETRRLKERDYIGSKPYKRYSQEELLDLKRAQEAPKKKRVEADKLFKRPEKNESRR